MGKSSASGSTPLPLAPGATECRSCGRRFGEDARFCPFDGEPLRTVGSAAPFADPLLGTTIDGRYVVERVLGEGGMGIVYRVRHKSLGRAFALKVLRAELAREPELAERFTQEAKAAAAIVHPNVVEITDFGTLPSGVPYFVMELLEGEPLSRLLRTEGPLAPPRGLGIVRQIAEGLAAAHAVGIVHRDLKPENVHVGARDAVKLLDFGVARIAGRSKLTKTGQVFGTPHYMSPEQASGQEVDHRSDIYSLGILMYEMSTGRVPFEADTFMGVLEKQIFTAPEPPSRVAPPAEPLGSFEEITLRCLRKKPEERYASLSALLADLRPPPPQSGRARTPRWGTLSPLPRRDGRAEREERSSLPAGLPPPLFSSRTLLVGVGGAVVAAALVLGIMVRGRPEPAAAAVTAPSAGGSPVAAAPPRPPRRPRRPPLSNRRRP